MAAETEVEIFPSFQAHAHGPRPPEPPLQGITIATEGLVHRAGVPPVWPLRGAFSVPRDPASDADEDVLRRIVLVLTIESSNDAQIRPMLRDEVVLPEDVEVAGDFVRGFFNVDLLKTFEVSSPEATYFVVASLGSHLSDVLAVLVRLPKRGREDDAALLPIEED